MSDRRSAVSLTDRLKGLFRSNGNGHSIQASGHSSETRPNDKSLNQLNPWKLVNALLRVSNGVGINGDGNTFAGRDVIYGEVRSLSNSVHQRFKEIDKAVNELVPGGILNPKKSGKVEQFSSARTFTSLTKIDVPIDASFKIIENLTATLKEVIGKDHSISTFHVRKAVVIAIHNLENPNVTPDVARDWCAKYIRKYGDPDHRIKVLYKNGDEEDLDYKFLSEILIPNLIEKILDSKFEDVEKIAISREMIDRMAKEIFSQVRSMSLLAIDYHGLLSISYNMAIQPPYPWLVESAYLSNIVRFHLKKSKSNAETLKKVKDIDLNTALHCSHEIIHHSTSSILGYYGQVLGCRYLSPLNVLRNVIGFNQASPQNPLWHFWKIGQIAGDLQAIDQPLENTMRLLKEASRNLHPSEPKDYGELFNYAFSLNDLATNLISTASQSREKVLGRWESAEQALDGCLALFHRVPKITIDSVEKEKLTIWVKHDLQNSVFRSIAPRIMISVSYNKEMSEEILNRCNCLVNKRPPMRYWNTVIIVYDNDECIMHESNFEGQLEVINIDRRKLRLLENSNDRHQRFSDIILGSI